MRGGKPYKHRWEFPIVFLNTQAKIRDGTCECRGRLLFTYQYKNNAAGGNFSMGGNFHVTIVFIIVLAQMTMLRWGGVVCAHMCMNGTLRVLCIIVKVKEPFEMKETCDA